MVWGFKSLLCVMFYCVIRFCYHLFCCCENRVCGGGLVSISFTCCSVRQFLVYSFGFQTFYSKNIKISLLIRHPFTIIIHSQIAIINSHWYYILWLFHCSIILKYIVFILPGMFMRRSTPRRLRKSRYINICYIECKLQEVVVSRQN